MPEGQYRFVIFSLDNDSPSPVVAGVMAGTTAGYAISFTTYAETGKSPVSPTTLPIPTEDAFHPLLVGTGTSINRIHYEESGELARIYLTSWVGAKKSKRQLYKGPATKTILFELEVDLQWKISLSISEELDILYAL